MTDFINTVPPTITGNRVVGGTLTASTGSWSPTPNSFTYQWQRADDVSGTNLETITAATGGTYTIDPGDTNKFLRVGVYPALSVTAPSFVSPTNGATLTGMVLLRGNCPTGTTSVQISVDGDAFRACSFRGTVWRVSLNTASYASGAHTITVRVNGSATTSVSCSFASGQTITPGICLFRLGGTGYANTTNKDKFSMFEVGQPGDGTDGDATSTAMANTRQLLWCFGVSNIAPPATGSNGYLGVPWSELVAHDWILTGAAGAYVPYFNGGSGPNGQYLMKIGDPGYQQALVDRILNVILPRFPQADGILIDDIQAQAFNTGPGSPNTTESIYPTNLAWREAMFSFVKNVGSQIADAGYVVGGNLNVSSNDFNVAGGSFPAWGSSSLGQQSGWITAVAPYFDISMYEYWMESAQNTPVRVQGATNATNFGSTGVAGWGTDFVSTVNGLGHCCFLVSQMGTAETDLSTATNVNRATYMKAAMLLDWDHRGGMCVAVSCPGHNYSTSTSVNNQWNASWTAAVGAPTGAKTQPQTNVWKRVFALKTVYLNANAFGSGNITVDGHILAPGEAVIV